MRVAEIFRSLQGEGFLTGAESAFVRTSGCNLRCWYCDTPYASWQPEGEDLSVDEIVVRVEALFDDAAWSSRIPAEARTWLAERGNGVPRPPDGRFVVLTGGEPMLFAELIPLAERLRRLGYHITVETAGTLYLPVACDLMSISPKLSSSGPSPVEEPRWHARHQRNRHAPEVIRRLTQQYAHQLKFVVDSPADCQEVERYLEEFPWIDCGRVMLMPQGIDRATLEERGRWLKTYCRDHGWIYCPRQQIHWFGHVRGT